MILMVGIIHGPRGMLTLPDSSRKIVWVTSPHLSYGHAIIPWASWVRLLVTKKKKDVWMYVSVQ